MIETAKQKIERLRDLRVRLKSGDYSGTDIMHAWIAVKEYADLIENDNDVDREEVVELVIAALRRALSSKTSPEMIEAIIHDTREELLPRAAQRR
jgi:hypothetical protein